MSQSKVTEYFCNRKRTFDVIQPSKKLRLDADYELKNKIIPKPPPSVKLQRHPATSKRKKVTEPSGNIKSFFNNTQCNKRIKSYITELSITTDSVIKQEDNPNRADPDTKSPGVLANEASPMSVNSATKDLNNSAKNTCRPNDPKNNLGEGTIPANHNRKTKISNFQELLKATVGAASNTSLSIPNRSNTSNDKIIPIRQQTNTTKLIKGPAQNMIAREGANVDQATFKEKIKSFREAYSKIKTEEKTAAKTPAYQRFQALSQKDTDSSLVLPYKYKVLLELFRSSETVVGMLYNRKEVCTFDKVKQGVQQLTKRTFTKEHLGQIVSVYPSAYSLHLDASSKNFISARTKANVTELNILPILPSANAKTNDGKSQLTPSVQLSRLKTFNQNLLAITKEHHERFLTSLNPPIQVPSSQVMRWHPKFLVDQVPDIPVSPLPECAESRVVTAQDVLEKVKGVVGERIEKALQSVSSTNISQAPIKSTTPPLKVASGALKGISQALLDKIRNKENAKIARDMLRNPESEKRIEMLSRLPELVRILRTFFVVEKRAAIALEDAKLKVCDSSRSPLSAGDVEKHLNLLAEVVPKWIHYVTIPKGVFIKIDKNVDLKDIMKAIDLEIVKEKS